MAGIVHSITLCLVAFSLSAQSPRRRLPVQASAPPPTFLGTEVREHAQGLEVVSVLPGSAAEKGGVKAGDLITHCMGSPVSDPRVLIRFFAMSRLQNSPLKLEILRQGQSLTLHVTPQEGAPSGQVSAQDMLTPKAPPKSWEGFNVLHYAALDKTTRQIFFWGAYDPRYATGAIDYESLLREALQSPNPSFSLEPTEAGRAAGQALDRQIAADAARMGQDEAFSAQFSQRLVRILSTDLAQHADGKRFSRQCGDAFGISAQEAMDLIDPARGQAARGMNGYMLLMAKALRNLKYEAVANAIETQVAGDVWGSIDRLGIGQAARATKAAYDAGRLTQSQATAQLTAEVWAALLIQSGLNSGEINGQRQRLGDAAFVSFATQRFTEHLGDKVMHRLFHGLVLGQATLQRIYPNLGNVGLQTLCSDGLQPNSHLARVFFEADVALKDILASGDLAVKIPGHVSQAQFMHDDGLQKGYSTQNGGVRGRTWLQPDAVAMQVSPDGQLIRFGASKLKIQCRGLDFKDSPPQAVQASLDAYGKKLTGNFEAYAREVPQLHALREGAKILALARWLRAQNLNDLQGVSWKPKLDTQPAIPASAPVGYVQATFLMEGQRLLLQPASIGGVDFSPKVGEGWVQSQADSKVIPSALGQLQASAALAEKAADAAIAGDLESARALAQQSADAMTGRLDIPVPPASLPDVPPMVMAQSSQGLLNRLNQNLEQLSGPNADQAKRETEAIKSQAYTLGQNPGAAPKVLAKLQAPGPLPVEPMPVLLKPKPLVTVNAPTTAGNSEALLPMTPEERALLLKETTALRQELCRIRTQFKRLDKNLQMDQKQRQDWEGEIDQAQQRAFERLKDVLFDQSAGELSYKWNQAIGKGQRSAEERARLAKGVQVLKSLQLAKSYNDFADWASLESVDIEYVRKGLKQAFDAMDGEERLRKLLSRVFKVKIAKRIEAHYKGAEYIVETAFDLASEGFAWARLRDLDRQSEGFLKAVKALSNRQNQVLAGIHEREQKLGLPKGATQDGCEP